jgi:putative transposase
VKHRAIKGKVKHITIKQDGEQWYCSVNCELKVRQPEVKTDNIIGIDVGLKTFATHSDGEIVENPKTLYKWQRKLNRANRRLHKRIKGSNRRSKQRKKVSRIHRRIRNIRRDFQHKETCCTIAKCDGVALENLNVRGMMKNHHLAKAIADCGWYEYKRQLKYKCQWYGKVFLEIGRFEPTSKCCSRCGWKDVNLCLSDRVFRCKCCGLEIDRDLNAAINIEHCGLNILWDTQKYTPGDDWRFMCKSRCQSMNQELKEISPKLSCVV